MKRILHALAVAISLLLPSVVMAQSAPATMPYHTVYGRLGAAPGDTGPGEAIPISLLFSNFGAVTNNATPYLLGANYSLLYDKNGVFGNIATAPNGVLCTDSLGAPSICIARKVLTAPVTLYVNENGAPANCNGQTCAIGSDASTNLCTSIATPCATRAHAINLAITNYDARLNQVTVQLSDQTYTTGMGMAANMVGAISGGNASQAQLIIQGNCTTPANTFINVAVGEAFTAVGVTSPVSLSCLKVASGNTHAIHADMSSIIYYSNINCGAVAGACFFAGYGSKFEQEGPETISGNMGYHWWADKGSQILTTGQTITCTGATFSVAAAFVNLSGGSQFSLNGSTFLGCGSFTGAGSKYAADYTSTFGAGTADPNTLFPGAINGGVNLPSFGLTGILIGQGGSFTGNTGLVTALGSSAGSLVYWSGSTLSNLASAANATLITDGSGTPLISQTLPTLVQQNISLSNPTTGTVAAARGGAGTITGALKGNGAGVVSQAACADLSNGATGCLTPIGTSGATLPLLNGTNTWSGLQNLNGGIALSAAIANNFGITNLTNTSNSSSATAAIIFANDAAAAGGFFFNSSTNTTYGGVSAVNLINISNNNMAFGTNNTVRMMVYADGGGIFGPGGTSPGAGNFAAANMLQTGAVAVASLPTCNSARKASRYFATDASATFTAGIGATVVGGGANNVPVTCDGTNWRIG